MTGEMYYIDDKTGVDSDGNEWPLHLAIAKELGGTLKPFDVYQGPYISFGTDITIGNSPYKMPIQHLGCIRLWIFEDSEGLKVYREDTEESVLIWFDETIAIEGARELLGL
jgi:hypothetical protein